MNGDKEFRFNIINIILGVQLAFLGLIMLNILGPFSLDSLQEIKAILIFPWLLFVPGFLILKALDVRTNLTKTFLLSLGASLSTLIISGMFGNFILGFLGVEKPISKIPIALLFSITVLVLAVVCRLKHRNCYFILPYFRRSLPPLEVLFSMLLPTSALLGVSIYLLNGNNLLILILLAIISLIPLLVQLNKLREKFYPSLIFFTSISLAIHSELLYMKSLGESAIAGVVETVGIWVPSFSYTHNSLLPTALLHPMLSVLSDMDIVQEVKITEIITFSFIPIVLYEIHAIFLEKKICLLSSFLFVFSPLLYAGGIIGTTRTGFSILFLGLFVLTIFSEEITNVARRILYLLFIFSIATSHYGTSYIFMFILIAIGLAEGFLVDKDKRIVRTDLIALYIVFSFFWYIYTSGSSLLDWGVTFAKHLVTSIFEVERSEVMISLAKQAPSLSLAFLKYFIIIVTFLTVIGTLSFIREYMKHGSILHGNPAHAGTTYIFFLAAFILPLMMLFLPYSSGGLRVYAMSLLLTSPSCIVGFKELLRQLGEMLLGSHILHINRRYLTIFSIFLCVSLSFNAGLVSNFVNSLSGSVIDFSHNSLIDKQKVQAGNNLDAKVKLYTFYPSDFTIQAAEWLFATHNPSRHIYVDYTLMRPFQLIRRGGETVFPLLSVNYGGKIVYEDMRPPTLCDLGTILRNSSSLKGYILLAYHNKVEGWMVIEEKAQKFFLNMSNYKGIFENMNKIYDNDGGVVLEKDTL
ncbi:MAG: DUF2206 domain-containing protein [Candidatus Bathyarchaeia archaeon]